ncbi:MAG: SPOR domain-containing protein [Hyphomicrobiales bacterium]
MTIKSITHKVVQVEKRKLDNERTSAFSTFALFAFWTLATTGALGLAAISFYTAKPRVEVADQSFGVDRVTTAGVPRTARPESLTERRQNTQLATRNDRRINDVTRVINRLRSEQATLNQRIAELDLSISKLRDENKTLKTKVSSLNLTSTQTASAPVIIPASPKGDQSPEQSSTLVPRSVDTKRVANGTDVLLTKPLAKNKTTAAEGISSFPKTKVASIEDVVDDIKVGSIPVAQTSRFALDLGASSTAARAQSLWKELGTQNPRLLTTLTPKFVATGVEEGQTRLVAGPFDNASDAIKACVTLRKIDAFCKTTLFPQ